MIVSECVLRNMAEFTACPNAKKIKLYPFTTDICLFSDCPYKTKSIKLKTKTHKLTTPIQAKLDNLFATYKIRKDETGQLLLENEGVIHNGNITFKYIKIEEVPTTVKKIWI